MLSEAREHGLERVLLDERLNLYSSYQAAGTPSAVLVDSAGRIASPLATGAAAITELVESAIAGEFGTNRRDEGFSVGARAPEIELPALTGGSIRLADFRGDSVLVLFWNPGCGSCQAMLDDLLAWEVEAPANAPTLLVVSSGSAEETNANGFRSPVVLDESFEVATSFGASATPMAVLIDEHGKIASPIVAGAEAVFALTGGELARDGMNERLSNDLARTLAEPMPRRRVLGAVGGFVLAAAFRPLSALGASKQCPEPACPPGFPLCAVMQGPQFPCPLPLCCEPGSRCCQGSSRQGQRAWTNGKYCCLPGFICSPANGGTCVSDCKAGQFRCGAYCCPDGSACENGRCIRSREVCRGPANRIDSVRTASGKDLGLTGSYFAVGQKIRATEEMKLKLGNDTVLLLEKGATFKVRACPGPQETKLELLVGKIWAEIKRTIARDKFIVETGSIVSPRGTKFWISYLPGKKRTTVRVFKGSVSFRNRYGVKHEIIVRAGQTGVQERNRAPRLVRR